MAKETREEILAKAELRRIWIEENPEIEEWLNSVSSGTAKLYASRFKRFYDYLTEKNEFMGFTPTQILDFQDNAVGRDRVKVANRLGLFCKNLSKELRPKTVSHYYSAVHSFFAYHGCELPKRGFTLDDDFKEPSKQLLRREDLVKIVQAAKLRDKALYTIAFMGAMGWNEFNQFNHGWDLIASQIDLGKDHLVVNLKARKRKRGLTNGFFTIVGKDGVYLLKEYLKIRGTPSLDEPIFLSREGVAIAARTYRKNFEILCRRVGLIKHRGNDRTSRFGYSPHQFRDVFRTVWQRSGADIEVAEFLMGHQVDSNKYLQFTKIPDYCVEEYKKAEDRLSLISKPNPDLVELDEVKKLREENRELKIQLNEVVKISNLQTNTIAEMEKRLKWMEYWMTKFGGYEKIDNKWMEKPKADRDARAKS